LQDLEGVGRDHAEAALNKGAKRPTENDPQPRGADCRRESKTCTPWRKLLQLTGPGNPTHSLMNNIEVEKESI